VPNYLETPEGAAGVREYMDYGVQLGRRFRALKLWLMLRTFGAEGVRASIREHVALARRLREAIAAEPGVVLAAPTPFSVVAFRWAPEGLSPAEADAANRRILERINADGRTIISHAMVAGRYTLRVAVGNARTGWRHLEGFLDAFRLAAAAEGDPRR
jgi:aromatic-L-amino-acid decarboxylase